MTSATAAVNDARFDQAVDATAASWECPQVASVGDRRALAGFA